MRLLTGSAGSGSSAPGDPATWRVSARNTGPAVAGRGWTLTLLLPAGSRLADVGSTPLRRCTTGTTADGAPYAQCTGRGPLSPGVTSFALDVVSTVPSAAAPGTRTSVVAWVAPAAGAPPETVPLGTPPTTATVDTDATSTDNDDGATVSVV